LRIPPKSGILESPSRLCRYETSTKSGGKCPTHQIRTLPETVKAALGLFGAIARTHAPRKLLHDEVVSRTLRIILTKPVSFAIIRVRILQEPLRMAKTSIQKNKKKTPTLSSRKSGHTGLGKAIIEGLKDVKNGNVYVIRKEALKSDIRNFLK
jgi:hypothetical protein